MARATILEGNIQDNLWPKVILVMIYIKNFHRAKALENDNTPHYAQHQEDPDTSHLLTLGSTVYVFLSEEERN